MTLREAKEILKGVVEGGKLITDQQQREASRLGLETMTYIELLRQTDPKAVPKLFHGETEE